MARYYCDYCKSYIKNDSSRSRKEHIRGTKHRQFVIEHYTKVHISSVVFEHYRTLFEEQNRGVRAH
ncbi:u1 small nuclear ribonucleoprotein [Blastocystis sp. subtype 4]|uniref:u1 small nuclear ribonucleoprotein n=1 Tax=Blastocystis sp. subtype 4 TaxID=944170 RepID=UPI00071164D6|nr:u1 small nuclear ribonucleoprotein [Blastocystis sp. subtype 4]KNB45974.1 u1 small nuclear ribonucleoprotein [Blastocystis sp. subtype 4]|eukprot:XP_014529417.1 u1 small nuclear ribonucleoprotein [Blastocystis sp. subtype 4]